MSASKKAAQRAEHAVGCLAEFAHAQERLEAARAALDKVEASAAQTLDATLLALNTEMAQREKEAREVARKSVNSAKAEFGTAKSMVDKTSRGYRVARKRVLSLLPLEAEHLNLPSEGTTE